MRVTTAIAAVLAATIPLAATADEWKAETWRSAEKLFRSDARWLGSDAAFSVWLGGDRVLWLFGDTFIGDGSLLRSRATFIRNSVAVQRGRDLSYARMDFYWKEKGGVPASFFPAGKETWLWPLHGIYRGHALTLFFMRVATSDRGLGFRLTGSAALRCENPEQPPERWTFHALALPRAPFDGAPLFGVAILNRLDSVFAYCVSETPGHPAYILKWQAGAFDQGDLSEPEWWDGSEFVPKRKLTGPPAAVIPTSATEFSVHRMLDGRFVQVQSRGFGATDVIARYAPRPEGPWSAPKALFEPRESGKRDANVYAAKAHPELEGAPLIVTYATNSFDFSKLIGSRKLYYPRVMRVSPR